MQTNPRIPADEYEAFGMAFMIGYIGWVPDDLQEVFPDDNFYNRPEFIDDTLAHMWRRGYDAGVAFYSDHALDEE
jgi:hypothetical protein